MDKGIRQGVAVKFAAMLPELATLGGKKFRRIILDWTVEEYKCTMAAASTHYNHAFQATKKATPELVVGLGRPEGKNNGGRKKKVVVAADPAAAAVDAPTGDEAGKEAVAETLAAAAGEAKALENEVQLVKVVRKADGVVVAEGITMAVASELVAKAKAAKKSSLEIV